MIKAPFNFVPLPSVVVFPDWSDLISFDIPFPDGISGSFSVKLTARTPIFVRNGHSRKDSEAEQKPESYLSFSHSNKDNRQFFIPATTVKGAVRNVLEIMSFGKMRLDKNAKFAQREWDNKDLYTLLQQNAQQKVRCGWLRRKGDDYEIIDCGRPWRIAQTRIDEYLRDYVFEDNFSVSCGRDLNKPRLLEGKEYDPKTAEFKYRLVKDLDLLRDIHFTEDDKYCTNSIQNRVKVDDKDERTGTIVLTGQPDLWKLPRPKKLDPTAGKFYEFVFRTPDSKAKHYPLTEEEFNQYKFIYTDSPDWKYAVDNMLEVTGIPVFFRPDEQVKDKIKDWGLAFLYKLPYEHTPYETLNPEHRSDSLDMADCIFGCIGDDNSLKGRVQFTPFWSKNAVEDKDVSLVLSGPKASYYPIYIDQTGAGSKGEIKGTYKTYNNGQLKGWKRYLLRKETWTDKSKDNDNKNITTRLRPLKAGAVFEGRVIFHNLKPEELGALLSSITFHGNEGSCRHQIGLAKPYGFGKVSVEVSDVSLESVGAEEIVPQAHYRRYMAIFEQYMTTKINAPWLATPTIRELLTLSRNEVTDNDKFNYMKLTTTGINEFVAAKGGKTKDTTRRAREEGKDATNKKEYLQYYSEIIGTSFSVPSLTRQFPDAFISLTEQRNKADEQEISRRKKAQEEEEKRIEAEKQKKLEEELRLKAEAEEKERVAKEKERLAKLEGGLAFLEEKYSAGPNAGSYKIENFPRLREAIDKWLKNSAQTAKIPESQYPVLGDALKRIATQTSTAKDKGRKRKKGKELPNPLADRASNQWTYIEDITSPEFANKLFQEINP